MVLRVRWDLELFVMKLYQWWFEVKIFLLYFLSFALLLALMTHSTANYNNLIFLVLTAMLGDRKLKDNSWARTSRNIQLTPRQNKPYVPLPNNKNLTPSRIEERMNTSPLRYPLENAINRAARDKSNERQSRSRYLGKSSRRDDSSIIRRVQFQEEDPHQVNRKTHNETYSFLKKYFDFDNPIPVGNFIDRLLQQYQGLWQNHQNLNNVMDLFTYKVAQIFGTQGIDPRELLTLTRQDGMIGLILQIFKSINESEQRASTYTTFSRSPQVQSINRSFEQQLIECSNIQNLKDVIQEFMELMYNQMENQIYKKFNVQMRRMVLKYRDAEKLIKKIQQKLTHHADYFEAEQKWQTKLKVVEERENQLKKKILKLQEEIKKEKESMAQVKYSKNKLQEQISKLRQNLQKYQNIMINKFESLNNQSESTFPSIPSQPSLTRRSTIGTPMMDRTQQFSNVAPYMVVPQPKPFQIKIDTHFIQRQNAPPLTQTTTTFMQPQQQIPGINQFMTTSHSPIKQRPIDMYDSSRPFQSSRPSVQAGGIKPGTKIGDYIYSPYTSRIIRQ